MVKRSIFISLSCLLLVGTASAFVTTTTTTVTTTTMTTTRKKRTTHNNYYKNDNVKIQHSVVQRRIVLNSSRQLDFDSSAAQQAGAGSATVDMNQYNLPLEQVYQEWTANVVLKTANTDEGLKLGVRNDREILIDTVQVSFPRKENAGLGILLQEIAGGRKDGLGITLVEQIVKDGPADGSGILPGDSITGVALLKTSTNGMEEFVEEFQVETECLGFDATLNAILSLPEQTCDNETFVVTLKRLRKKPKVKVHIQYPPEQNEPNVTLELFSGEILRQGMLVRGVKLNDVLAQRFDGKPSGGNCGGNALCRTCAVSVLKGGELLNPMKLSEQQIMRDNPRWRLACKSVVGWGMAEGEMTIRVNPRQWD